MRHGFLLAIALSLCVIFGAFPAFAQIDDDQEKLTPREEAFVAAHPRVRLGVWTNVPPYMMAGPDQSFKGVLADFAALISRRCGIHFSVVTFDKYPQARQAAMQGEVDLLPTVTPSIEHIEAFNFSQTYAKEPIALMTREDAPPVIGFRDLLGKKVAVSKGHIVGKWIRRDYPHIDVIPAEDYAQGLMLVAKGQADAFAGALGAMLHFARDLELSNLKLATATEYEYRVGFAVRKDWPLLTDILNKAIASISPKEKADIRNRWIVLYIEKAVDWGMVINISLVIAIFALITLYFINSKNKWLRREIAVRKRIEKDLLDAKRRLKDILQFLPDPTWVIDTEGRVIFWNQAMERLTGVQAAKILGKGEYEYSLAVYGERRPSLIDLVLKGDDHWESQYLSLEEIDGVLTISESFHPNLGNGGVYLSGSAGRLYDSEGNLVGAIETVRDITHRKQDEQEREKLIAELQQALANVKTLSGLLPICSHCKKIRDDQGYWSEVEEYIRDHSDAGFSHGICPDCLSKYYPDLKPSLEQEKQGK